jgi:hypothetical protein
MEYRYKPREINDYIPSEKKSFKLACKPYKPRYNGKRVTILVEPEEKK